MTLQEFARIYAVLALQLRVIPDEETVAAYYDVLQGVDIQNVFAAAKFFAVEPGRRFFPTTAEWHDRAFQSHQREIRKALPAARAEAWRHDCDDCEDCGWLFFTCSEIPCDRRHDHHAHRYVRPCGCRASNATWKRKNPVFQAART